MGHSCLYLRTLGNEGNTITYMYHVVPYLVHVTAVFIVHVQLYFKIRTVLYGRVTFSAGRYMYMLELPGI